MDNKTFVNHYFSKESNAKEQFICKCGRPRKQDLKRGRGNLMEHIIREHPNYREGVKIAMQCVNFLPVTTEKAKNIFGWIDWESNVLPFNFCKNELPRQNTK